MINKSLEQDGVSEHSTQPTSRTSLLHACILIAIVFAMIFYIISGKQTQSHTFELSFLPSSYQEIDSRGELLKNEGNLVFRTKHFGKYHVSEIFYDPTQQKWMITVFDFESTRKSITLTDFDTIVLSEIERIVHHENALHHKQSSWDHVTSAN